MHPYHHALSSQRAHGGVPADYLPLHSWFDASKSALAYFTHRALHHHREGIAEAVRIFGATIRNADDAAVSVEALAVQHCAEDMSILPTAADWLAHMDLPSAGFLGPPRDIPPIEKLAASSARHFETPADALLPLHAWFLETASWFGDARHLAMRHHSFGIFEAEQRFGVALDPDRRSIPTRMVGEWHVRSVMGRIPAATDFIRRIKGQPWMAAAHNARRRGLG